MGGKNSLREKLLSFIKGNAFLYAFAKHVFLNAKNPAAQRVLRNVRYSLTRDTVKSPQVKISMPTNEVHNCPVCNGRSRLIGTSAINSTKLAPQPHLEKFISLYNEVGYNEQKIFLCQDCGLVFVRPFPSDAEVVAIEAKIFGVKVENAPVWQAPRFVAPPDTTWAPAVRAPRISQIIQQHYNSPVRVLDIGAHGGIVSLALNLPNGSSVDLVQGDTDVAVGAERPNVRQFRGLLQDLRHQNYHADVVLALHVLEHVDAPKDFLALICQLLSDKGMCIIEVPYELQDAWSTAVNRIFSPNHKSFFAPWSVFEAVRLAGMRIVDYEMMDCHNTGYSNHAPTPGAVIRVCAQKENTLVQPVYPAGYSFVRSIDRLLGSFAGSLAYLSSRPFFLFVYRREALQMASLFTDRPNFKGMYSSDPELIDGVTIKDIYAAKLSPENVIVTLDPHSRDDLKRHLDSSVIEII